MAWFTVWLWSIFYYHFDNSGQRAAIGWLFGLTWLMVLLRPFQQKNTLQFGLLTLFTFSEKHISTTRSILLKIPKIFQVFLPLQALKIIHLCLFSCLAPLVAPAQSLSRHWPPTKIPVHSCVPLARHSFFLTYSFFQFACLRRGQEKGSNGKRFEFVKSRPFFRSNLFPSKFQNVFFLTP